MKWESVKSECSKCGGIKVGSYLKESWCGICIGARRKELRRIRREEKDLPPIGSGRDPKCKKCRSIKEKPYVNGSLCSPCKLAYERERYEKARIKKGTPPRRIGRNPVCKCGQAKEYPNEAHCRNCTAERRRKEREAIKSDPVKIKERREKALHRFTTDAEFKRKKLCRLETRKLIRAGLIECYACEICGDENSECHHEDYNNPLDVRWFCKIHHEQLHHGLLDKIDKQKTNSGDLK